MFKSVWLYVKHYFSEYRILLLLFLISSIVSPLQGQMDDEHDVSDDRRRRKNHTALERQRRSEQRTLFDKLQTILESDPRAPRLRLLSLVSSIYCLAKWSSLSLYSVVTGHKLQENFSYSGKKKNTFFFIFVINR